jgi:predicted dehydrogenase
VRALEAGVAVLVEKPMALTVDEGRRMAEATSRAGRRVQVGFARRFREPYRRLRSALEAIDRREWRAVHFELAFPTTGWNAHTAFLGDDAQGGGVLDDVLSHQVAVRGLRLARMRVRDGDWRILLAHARGLVEGIRRDRDA